MTYRIWYSANSIDPIMLGGLHVRRDKVGFNARVLRKESPSCHDHLIHGGRQLEAAIILKHALAPSKSIWPEHATESMMVV